MTYAIKFYELADSIIHIIIYTQRLFKVQPHQFSILQFLNHEVAGSVHVRLGEWNTGMGTCTVTTSVEPASKLQGEGGGQITEQLQHPYIET